MRSMDTGPLRLLIFIIVVLAVVGSVFSVHISCNSDEVREYQYVSVTSSFSRKSDQSTTQDKTITTATVLISCLERAKIKNDDVLLWWLRIDNIQNVLLNEKTVRRAKQSTNLDNNKYDIVFAQNRKGRVYKLIKHKKEDEAILAIKKNVVEMLQSKVSGSKCARRTVALGDLRFCFKKRFDSDNHRFIIRGHATERDIVKVAAPSKGVSTRHDSYSLDQTIVINDEGWVELSSAESEFGLGAGSHQSHKAFKQHTQVKHTGTEMDKVFSGGIPIQSKSKTILKIQNSYSSDSKEKQAQQAMQLAKEAKSHLKDKFGSLGQIFNSVNTHPDIELDDLKQSEEYARQLREQYKMELQRTFPFLKKLLEFKQQKTKNNQLFHELRTYLGVVDFDRRKLYDICFPNQKKKLSTSIRQRATEFQKSCQALLIVGDSKQGQQLLIHTMRRNLDLLDHGLIQFLHIRNPVPNIKQVLITVQHLKKLQKFMNQQIPNDKFIPLREQAYLILAAVSRHLTSSQGKTLVRLYQKHLKKSMKKNDDKAILTSAHALGNMGDTVPLDFLMDKVMHYAQSNTNIAKAFVEGFRNHISPSSHDAATLALSLVALHPELDTSLRVAAVKTQMERELKMDASTLGSATDVLGLLYHHPQQPMEIHNAVEQYLVHAGTHDAGEILDNVNEARQNFDAEKYAQEVHTLLFGRIKKALKKVGNAIKKTVDKVVNAVKSVGDLAGKVKGYVDMAKDLFKSMDSVLPVYCFHMNYNAQKQLCVRDPDMMNFLNFVQKNGNLPFSAKDGKGFAFEEYFGPQAIHVYIGALGGVYGGIKCNDEDAELSISAFARANLRAQFFKKKIDIVVAEGYFILHSPKGEYPIETGITYHKGTKTKRNPMPAGAFLKDKIYLKLLGAVIVNTHVLPEDARKSFMRCDSREKTLLSKSWNPIFSFQFQIPISVVMIEVKVSATATLSVIMEAFFCPTRLHISFGVGPQLELSVSVNGAVSLLGFIKAGIEGTASSLLRYSPSFGLYGCQYCGMIKQYAEPFNADFKFFAGALGMNLKFPLWSGGVPPRTKDLFKKCKDLPIKKWVWQEHDADDILKTLMRLTAVANPSDVPPP